MLKKCLFCFVSWKSLLLQLSSFDAKVLKIPIKWHSQIWTRISTSSGLIHHLLSVMIKFSFLWLKNNFHSFVNLNTIKICKSDKRGIFFFEVWVSIDMKEGL